MIVMLNEEDVHALYKSESNCAARLLKPSVRKSSKTISMGAMRGGMDM